MQLVAPNQVVQNNYDGVRSPVATAHIQNHHASNSELYERLVKECQAQTANKEDLLKNEREAKENYKRKYEKMKLRVQELEALLKI